MNPSTIPIGPRMIWQQITPTMEQTSPAIACFFALSAAGDIALKPPYIWGGGAQAAGAPPKPPCGGENGAPPKLGGETGAPNDGGWFPKLELWSFPKLVPPKPGSAGGGYEDGAHGAGDDGGAQPPPCGAPLPGSVGCVAGGGYDGASPQLGLLC